MEEQKLDIYKRLNEACDDRNIQPWGRNQVLRKELHVSQPAVSKWLTGKGYPSIETLVQIAKFLQVNVEWLITGQGPKSINERYPSKQIEEIVNLLENQPKEKQDKVLAFVKLFLSE